ARAVNVVGACGTYGGVEYRRIADERRGARYCERGRTGFRRRCRRFRIPRMEPKLVGARHPPRRLALLAAPAHPHFRLAPPRRFGESERAEYACDFCIESPEPSRCPYDSGGAPCSFSISFGAGHAQGILRCALSSRAPLLSRTFHQRFELLSGSAVFWSFSHSTARGRHARDAAVYGRFGGSWLVRADFSRRQDDRCRGDFYVSARRRDDCIAAAGSGGPHPDSRIGSSLASHLEARNSRAYSRDIWQAAAVERRRLSRERTTSAR